MIKRTKRNPVHKNMEEFNKPKTHKDKKKEYKRKLKHKEIPEE